jgi:hypothetical protein
LRGQNWCVFSDILNVRESYGLGSHARVFHSEVYAILACSEYCISEGSRAALLALKSYAVSFRAVLQCGYFCFRNWFCLTEFNWCGSLDTVVSMEMKRPTHSQERVKVLLL